MRIIFVLITGITLLFLITMGWYISNTVASSILYGLISGLTLSESAENVVSLATFVNIIWGPALDIITVIWMIAAAQQRDVESELYG